MSFYSFGKVAGKRQFYVNGFFFPIDNIIACRTKRKPADGLLFCGDIPPWIEDKDIIGLCEVQPKPSALKDIRKNWQEASHWK